MIKHNSTIKPWKRISILAILCLFSFSVVSDTASAAELDESFYAGNEILFYDPDAVGLEPCEATPVVSGGGSGGNVPLDFSIGNGVPQRPANLAKYLMGDLGLTVEQAAGIVGNFMHESGGDDLPPDVNQGGQRGSPNNNFAGGNAYGWAQWDGPRKQAFIQYGYDNGYTDSTRSPATDGSNYAFLLHELDTTEAGAITALKETSTASEAAAKFEEVFERAGVVASEQRDQYANQVVQWVSSGGQTDSDSDSDTPINSDAAVCGGSDGGGSGSTLVGAFGDSAFPLGGGKSVVSNPGIFNNNTTDQAGHPYTAYDISAATGTQVNAFIDGTVTNVSADRCPGRMISIYSQTNDVVVNYLHLSMDTSTHVKKGDTIQAGDRVGQVGTGSEGCLGAHLHIDVVEGDTRVACSRLSCPSSNASLFVDIGPDLYTTFEALPE